MEEQLVSKLKEASAQGSNNFLCERVKFLFSFVFCKKLSGMRTISKSGGRIFLVIIYFSKYINDLEGVLNFFYWVLFGF